MIKNPKAEIIFKDLFNNIWFMHTGYKNDHCVDFCIAAQLEDMREDEAYELLMEKAEAAWKRRKDLGLTEADFDYLGSPIKKHFDRIWYYADGVWRRDELESKLIDDYDFSNVECD